MDKVGLGKMDVDELAIGQSVFWTNWVLDEVGMDKLGVDEVGMDERALGRSGCGRSGSSPLILLGEMSS